MVEERHCGEFVSPRLTNKQVSIRESPEIREFNQNEDVPTSRTTRFDDTIRQNSDTGLEMYLVFDEDENIPHFEDPNICTNFDGWIKSVSLPLWWFVNFRKVYNFRSKEELAKLEKLGSIDTQC